LPLLCLRSAFRRGCLQEFQTQINAELRKIKDSLHIPAASSEMIDDDEIDISAGMYTISNSLLRWTTPSNHV